jgi:hypothetical protein
VGCTNPLAPPGALRCLRGRRMVFNEQQNEIPLKIDRIMTAHLTIAALSLVALVGCGTGYVPRGEFPVGWKAVQSSGNFITYVIPVAMDDGTKCVITKTNGSGGGGITCDWRTK